MPVILGLPKGSLQDATFNMMRKAGFNVQAGSRSYVPSVDDPELQCRLIRPQEISRYVELGLLDAGINLQNVTTAISFLTQRTAEQLENITIMCDGQQVHECTDSEQMVALLQSGRAVFGVSVGSLWKQIRETLAHEEYVDLTTMPSMMGGNRPVDDITAMRMRKNFEAQHQTRAAASL